MSTEIRKRRPVMSFEIVKRLGRLGNAQRWLHLACLIVSFHDFLWQMLMHDRVEEDKVAKVVTIA